jgi:murein DD-endopeptidase MepM/ murein hydrolase activator NlpD
MTKLLFLFLFFTCTVFANFKLPKNSPYPGGIAVVNIGKSDKYVLFDNKKVFTIKNGDNWYALVGIGLNETRKKITIRVSGRLKEIDLKSKEYTKQYITLKGDRKKYVGLSKKNLDRHYKEKAQSKNALHSYSKLKVKNLDFVKPVNKKFSDSFGKRRYFNNQPRKPHSGTDMSAKLGTPIKAVLDGTVKIAKDFFFSGNVIYLDHGKGLITVYAHLDKFKVKAGDKVKQNDIIGLVGKTGRVTGAHLHYGVGLNGNMIDPKLFY